MVNIMENRVLDIGGESVGYDQIVDHNLGALILGIAPRSLQNLGYNRQIPIYQMGRRNRFLVADLIDYSEECRVEATND
jgi:hypothetical protein